MIPLLVDAHRETLGLPLAEHTETVELPAGSAVFFHGYLVHGSERNGTDGFRHALTFHYMNAYSPLPWTAGRDDYRDVFPVPAETPASGRGMRIAACRTCGCGPIQAGRPNRQAWTTDYGAE